MKHIIIFAVLFFSAQAHAWVINANFEKGKVGEIAEGSNAFSDGFRNTKYTKDKVHGGSLAAVTSIKEGETAFGDWGGQFVFPSKLGEGDEIWYRVWIYYPEGFDFTNNGIGVKTLRIHTHSADGSHQGYFDLLSNKSHLTTVIEHSNNKEFTTNNPNWRSIGSKVTTGVWHALEMYAKLSSVSGKGIYRLWMDGELILEDTASANLKTSGSKADFAYLWSYFNGGSPKDQKAYVDDVIITNEAPNAKDSHGNRYIGVGNASFTAAPKPPTMLGLINQ